MPEEEFLLFGHALFSILKKCERMKRVRGKEEGAECCLTKK